MSDCSTASTEFSTVVQRAREARGLSITEAAEKAGVDRVTWWRVETGRSTPSLDTARDIARVLGIRVLNGNGHEDDPTKPVNGGIFD